MVRCLTQWNKMKSGWIFHGHFCFHLFNTKRVLEYSLNVYGRLDWPKYCANNLGSNKEELNCPNKYWNIKLLLNFPQNTFNIINENEVNPFISNGIYAQRKYLLMIQFIYFNKQSQLFVVMLIGNFCPPIKKKNFLNLKK